MKGVRNDIIRQHQSVFVPSRMIFDNAMVAYETIHTMKGKYTSQDGHMALKLYISKAYRVEWQYLKGVMKTLGFFSKWTSLIMNCVASISYSVVISGHPYGYIKPMRGLKQGDPLSLYLFLLCVEGLSCLLNRAKQD